MPQAWEVQSETPVSSWEVVSERPVKPKRWTRAGRVALGFLKGAGRTISELVPGSIPPGYEFQTTEGSRKPLINLEPSNPEEELGASIEGLAELVPLAGAGLGLAGRYAIGPAAKGLGKRLLEARLKMPGASYSAGAKPETFFKYGLGGSFEQMAQKTVEALRTRATALRSLLSKAGENAPKLNLEQTLDEAERELLADPRNSGILDALQNQVARWRKGIEGKSFDLLDSNKIKHQIGLEGTWSYDAARGKMVPTPDVSATERLANAWYPKIRQAIENAAAEAGPGVARLNRELGELIPAQNALVRRIPIEKRQDVLPLIETVWAAGRGDIVGPALYWSLKRPWTASKLYSVGARLTGGSKAIANPATQTGLFGSEPFETSTAYGQKAATSGLFPERPLYPTYGGVERAAEELRGGPYVQRMLPRPGETTPAEAYWRQTPEAYRPHARARRFIARLPEPTLEPGVIAETVQPSTVGRIPRAIPEGTASPTEVGFRAIPRVQRMDLPSTTSEIPQFPLGGIDNFLMRSGVRPETLGQLNAEEKLRLLERAFQRSP